MSDWLAAWRAHGIGVAEALGRFDALDPIEPAAMLGRWRGVGLPTGHPLDGLLEALGWHGKAFEAVDRVQPLLFRDAAGRPVALEPTLLPVGLALRWPGLARRGAVRAVFRVALPLLRARRPGARLERLEHRGKASAAMVYRRQPITDHFRRIDDDRVLGLMVTGWAVPPYFFLLERAAGLGAGGADGEGRR